MHNKHRKRKRVSSQTLWEIFWSQQLNYNNIARVVPDFMLLLLFFLAGSGEEEKKIYVPFFPLVLRLSY